MARSVTAPRWLRRLLDLVRDDRAAYRRHAVAHRPAVAKAAGWSR